MKSETQILEHKRRYLKLLKERNELRQWCFRELSVAECTTIRHKMSSIQEEMDKIPLHSYVKRQLQKL